MAVSVYIPPKVLAELLASGTLQLTNDGLEKRCPTCRDYWPADTEFFLRDGKQRDGLQISCRACQVEMMRSCRTAEERT